MPTSRWTTGLWISLLLGCTRPPAPPVAPAPPRSIIRDQPAEVQINLVAFAQLYGLIRFFHPTDAAEATDWHQLAVIGALRMREVITYDDLAQQLHTLLSPIAPSLQLWFDNEPPPDKPPVLPTNEELVYWQYQGFPGSLISLHRPPYRTVRVSPEQRWRRYFADTPPPNTQVQIELAPGLRARLPIVLNTTQAHQAHRPPSYVLPPGIDLDRSIEVLAVRQAAVIELWNILRHFYPYQQDLSLDWTELLRSGLADAEDDLTLEDARNTLRGLLVPLEDGHGYVGHRSEGPQRANLPFRMELVQAQPIITATRDPDRFFVGDIVRTIDGVYTGPHISQLAERLSGTPQWRAFRAAAWEATIARPGETIPVRIERDGVERTLVTTATREPVPTPPRPAPLHTFEDGVRYIDLTRTSWTELHPLLPELAGAPGLIFDLRGYPKHNDEILDHLLEQPEDTKWMHVPRFIEPGGQAVGWYDLGWHRRPASPHIDAPVVFLINAEAISYAESILAYVSEYHLGILVGSPTAGANGDIVRIDTVGGFFIIYSGMQVTQHDGCALQRRGIAPDIRVQRTIAGLRAGRDEILEAGRQALHAPTSFASPRLTRRCTEPSRPLP